jgi:hypothetical protein
MPEDGSVATEPTNGMVLIGVGKVANTALARCGLGLFVQIREPTAIVAEVHPASAISGACHG